MKARIIFMVVLLAVFGAAVYGWTQIDSFISSPERPIENESTKIRASSDIQISDLDRSGLVDDQKIKDLKPLMAIGLQTHPDSESDSTPKVVYVGVDGNRAIDLITGESLGSIFRFSICLRVNNVRICRNYSSDGVETFEDGKQEFKNLRFDGREVR